MQDAVEVAAGLDEMAALLRFNGAPKFKVRAYERAARVVDAVGEGLASSVEQQRLRKLEGIGAALAAQIAELWNSGTSSYLERLREEAPEGAAELVRVPGLSPRRIRALHDALGIRSVEELHRACLEERVRGVKGFGAKTEARLASACERWLGRSAAAPEPLILARALELAELLQQRLASTGIEAAVAGAVRRGEDTVDRLDLVVVGETAPALHSLERLRQVLRTDSARGIAVLGQGLLLHLHATDTAHFGNTLFVATGTPQHIAAVTERAARGSPAPELPPFSSEVELYASVGLPLVPPELRNGTDELSRAERGGFGDLLGIDDIRGFVHCHTDYSDGRNTVLEMAVAAEAMGMKYITITDHSPSAFYARGVPLDALKRQWDEIAAAQEKVSIRILRGTESDILRDGYLDYPDSILEQLDVVIASIHSRYRMTSEEMTRRLSVALSLPIFKIWGHGLGRILNHRPAFDCDLPAVLDVLAASRGAIELNADPHRLDLPASFIPGARDRGIPFVVSVDAHSTRGLGVLRHGVTMARRGALTRRHVLNSLPPSEFIAAVRPIG